MADSASNVEQTGAWARADVFGGYCSINDGVRAVSRVSARLLPRIQQDFFQRMLEGLSFLFAKAMH
ncbi:hypothetical protein GCM10007388_40190 [Pseudoduganella plicata]|uniref:Uncharacterized protein n=1 Tax=Pseudoduganella plicata TaxID=321984 RepID=A0AA87YG45_9BURK|nr:hypothetical protein GCM10007388_40190 [Pseudoduganella plicata]